MLAGLARGIIETHGQQFANRLDVIRKTKSHRWRPLNGLMDSAKIKMRDVQADSSDVVSQCA
jgi:hypothetical protein